MDLQPTNESKPMQEMRFESRPPAHAEAPLRTEGRPPARFTVTLRTQQEAALGSEQSNPYVVVLFDSRIRHAFSEVCHPTADGFRNHGIVSTPSYSSAIASKRAAYPSCVVRFPNSGSATQIIS